MVDLAVDLVAQKISVAIDPRAGRAAAAIALVTAGCSGDGAAGGLGWFTSLLVTMARRTRRPFRRRYCCFATAGCARSHCNARAPAARARCRRWAPGSLRRCVALVDEIRDLTAAANQTLRHGGDRGRGGLDVRARWRRRGRDLVPTNALTAQLEHRRPSVQRNHRRKGLVSRRTAQGLGPDALPRGVGRRHRLVAWAQALTSSADSALSLGSGRAS